MNIKSFFRFIACAPCAVFLSGVMLATAPQRAHAKLATVGAVHDYVNKVWGIEIPHGAAASNLLNMHYLMQLVDAANLELNQFPISAYANDAKYATTKIAADTAAKQAVETLIKNINPLFFFKSATTSKTVSFDIRAAETFYIAWGDGTMTTIEKTDTNSRSISHTYLDAAANYEIAIGGQATAYTDTLNPCIRFSQLSAIRGCLGCIFSTIDDNTVAEEFRQPRFIGTFNGSPIQTIPSELFNGVHGAPVASMFFYTFYGCNKLISIPENLFADISGPPAREMFVGTFELCTGLTGPIPDNLFAGISGPPAYGMFWSTFNGDSGLTSIPENLFGDIVGPAASLMFNGTFSGCSSLRGPSAKVGKEGEREFLYVRWPSIGATPAYKNANGFSDYECIPTSWGGAGTKKPGECETSVEDVVADADD